MLELIMVMGEVFERFVRESPICIMIQVVLEKVLGTAALDALFERVAERQYTRQLLFSTVVELMSEVVCQVRTSVHASYLARRERLNVSLKALYDKLNGMELGVMAALVRHTYQQLAPVQDAIPTAKDAPLPGFDVRIVDGNHLARTEHRLKPLRQLRAGPLPGQALVVYDPQRHLIADMIGCEDGHAQERVMTPALLALVKSKQLWVADRNFCTMAIVSGIVERSAYFLIRQHASTLVVLDQTRPRRVGRSLNGMVYTQSMTMRLSNGRSLTARRITVKLNQPTREDESEVYLLTNLPAAVDTLTLTELYRGRWEIERAFQEIEAALNSEITTLAYPKAALFAFSLALVAANALAVIKHALVAAHREIGDANQISGYYLAEEIAATYHGMMIALPESAWRHYQQLDTDGLVRELCQLATRVYPLRFRKNKRGPKKPQPCKQGDAKIKHVATARVLAKNKAVVR